jgi:hypothetical protein
MDATSARMKRIDDARQHRSDAMNRRLITDAERIEELEAHLKCTYLTITILVMVMATVGFGLK